MLRGRTLPGGWYPSSDEEVRSTCARWESTAPALPVGCAAAIVPHAGWAFSGRLAYQGIRSLRRDVETVVVCGGHLRPNDAVQIAPEDGYATPSGDLPADLELAEALREAIATETDRARDNTVEVQLPLIAHLFPGARALYLRCPPSGLARSVGEMVARYASATGRRVCVVGSTDLTHYGPAYRFTPVGRGPRAADWVREENDRHIVDAMAEMDAQRTIALGLETGAACSAGAAAAAIAFAGEQGVVRGTVIEYAQSRDLRPDDSFVGYVAVGYAMERA